MYRPAILDRRTSQPPFEISHRLPWTAEPPRPPPDWAAAEADHTSHLGPPGVGVNRPATLGRQGAGASRPAIPGHIGGGAITPATPGRQGVEANRPAILGRQRGWGEQTSHFRSQGPSKGPSTGRTSSQTTA